MIQTTSASRFWFLTLLMPSFYHRLSDWLYFSGRKIRRALAPAPAPFRSLQPDDFVRGAASFPWADPRRPFFNAPLLMMDLAQRASALLSSQADSLERAALELETQHQHAALSGPLDIQRGYFLISLERQRAQLAQEREALCLLAYACQQALAPNPSSPSSALSPPSGALAEDRGPQALVAEAPSLARSLRPLPLDAPQPLLDGQTLLCFFISARHFELCALLLELGASGEALSANGDSPLALAERKARAMEGRSGSALAESRQAQRIAVLLQKDALSQISQINPAQQARALGDSRGQGRL